ncbi:hypothetical protein B0H65DRAFT_161490 [Neurospora tetraspora]|uniref:Uncharacterized protein n=1 Tax=Neurospora tetraspora TaxID=94610 RepID=A0AAE0MT91_9PEZI|nr:hypothetical protein B0H65DRAFT_161490 [Neurospora tetraspora]
MLMFSVLIIPDQGLDPRRYQMFTHIIITLFTFFMYGLLSMFFLANAATGRKSCRTLSVSHWPSQANHMYHFSNIQSVPPISLSPFAVSLLFLRPVLIAPYLLWWWWLPKNSAIKRCAVES